MLLFGLGHLPLQIIQGQSLLRRRRHLVNHTLGMVNRPLQFALQLAQAVALTEAPSEAGERLVGARGIDVRGFGQQPLSGCYSGC